MFYARQRAIPPDQVNQRFSHSKSCFCTELAAFITWQLKICGQSCWLVCTWARLGFKLLAIAETSIQICSRIFVVHVVYVSILRIANILRILVESGQVSWLTFEQDTLWMHLVCNSWCIIFKNSPDNLHLSKALKDWAEIDPAFCCHLDVLQDNSFINSWKKAATSRSFVNPNLT